jgi:hypothetical protein
MEIPFEFDQAGHPAMKISQPQFASGDTATSLKK